MSRSAVAMVAASLLVVGSAPARSASEADAATADAREVLDAAVRASERQPFEGRVVVASFDTTGPNLLELDVQRAVDGELRVGRSEAWMVGRTGDGSFLLEPQAGSLLRLGGGERLSLEPADLLESYEVAGEGVEQLPTGPADALALRRGGVVRERLFVDRATGLIVRRETYDLAGDPRRLVAFVELVASAPVGSTLPSGLRIAEAGPTFPIAVDELDHLARDGWAVRPTLPGGFRLAASSTLHRGGTPSLHLVYTDGLYTLSLYQQRGQLDEEALDGATRVAVDEGDVYRWPGSEPERVVWSAHERTYTAVSDAPRDAVAAAIATLPQGEADSLPDRIGRGLGRVASWLWPFG